MTDTTISTEDIALYGQTAASALAKAATDGSLTDEGLREFYGLLIKHDIISLVAEEADDDDQQRSAAVDRADTADDPNAPGGDGSAVSPPAAPSSPAKSKPGTRTNPIEATTEEDVEKAARNARKPSEAQAGAGNYSKGHLRWRGIIIAIETPKGRLRGGRGADGKKWSVKMPVGYGYIKRSKGADGDPVDVFIGPRLDSNRIYVIDQVDAETGEFDELKVVIGAGSERQARMIYRRSFSDERGGDRIGGVKEMTANQIKRWIKDGGGADPLTMDAQKA